jgi:hypothetical protein
MVYTNVGTVRESNPRPLAQYASIRTIAPIGRQYTI